MTELLRCTLNKRQAAPLLSSNRPTAVTAKEEEDERALSLRKAEVRFLLEELAWTKAEEEVLLLKKAEVESWAKKQSKEKAFFKRKAEEALARKQVEEEVRVNKSAHSMINENWVA